jgi:hypothetical protein
MVRPRRLSKHLAPVVLAGVAFGIAAAPASASTAQLMELMIDAECKYVPPDGECLPASVTTLAYEAGPGEANRVRMRPGPGGIRVTDAGAAVDPGPGCSRTGARSVRCDVPATGVYVATGGGADRVRIELDEPTAVDGGPGDDVLVGGPGRDRLYGGQGADALRGGADDDELYDGSLARPLRAGDLNPFYEYIYLDVDGTGRGGDSFDGGRGRDTVGYQGRSRGIRVDLATTAEVAGARGERDSVRGVESAVGGEGDDRLAGNRRSNGLGGGGGDDVIRGRRGHDGIGGGSGNNTIFAGPGRDEVSSSQPSDVGADRMFCGPGADRLWHPLPSDFVNDDCEALEFPVVPPHGIFASTVTSTLPLGSDGSLVVLTTELWCPAAVAVPCGLELSLLVEGPGGRGGTAPPRGTLLGSASHTLAPNEYRTVTLSLSEAGARILRRHRALRVRVHVDEGAPQPPAGYMTILRAPR